MVLLLFAAGCGGGDDTLSAEEYFTQIQQLDDASEERQSPLRAEYDAAIAGLPDAEVATRVTAETIFYEGLVEIGKDYVNAIDDLAPPTKVKDAHEEYVAAYDEVLIELNVTLDQIPGVTSMNALAELLTRDDLLAAFTRADQACEGLQSASSTVDADVDLECRS